MHRELTSTNSIQERDTTNKSRCAMPYWLGALSLSICSLVQASDTNMPTHEQLNRPFAAPPSARLQFDVKGKVSGFGYSASAKLDWLNSTNSYQVEQSIKAPIIGTRSQRSQGSIDSHYLQPHAFEDSSRSKRNLRFTPSKGTVTIPATQIEQSIPEGAQDRLSVFFQLSGVLAGNPDLRATGKQIPIWTVASNKQEAWVFEVENLSTISLPAGQIPAIKLKRLPRKPDDQAAEIWLSPAIGYLPVRIHFEDDRDAVDLQMSSYTLPDRTKP
ncbi:DUF3108 domain-containing protein [Lampropedia puyangensis]|uniref:DUF3108 domain-containing protein n=1 Tax=Lampropedia puyangensis TaxID=1330072 RepID=A0A4S8EZA8_9BURK|nr:DUF3108 domain-containing protein [Lampropedia puyangensis]THT99650.1 DUF3108 domain-containing protein [Lampropedia puyangensis]